VIPHHYAQNITDTDTVRLRSLHERADIFQRALLARLLLQFH
jgi:hypothetical protein